tara:strand:+ start:2231 stop:2944 length:714 start_codon:yes stop_codon:yes gene_type:complete
LAEDKYYGTILCLCRQNCVPVRTGALEGEKKMGRPVNKNFIGDGTGKIQVTAVKFAAGGEILTEAHITKQRSANKFIVTDGSKEETCTLVNKSIGALGASEFCINSTDSDGTTQQVTKLYNRKAQVEVSTNHRYEKNADSTRALTDTAVITGATQADPVVITSAGHGFANGTKVSIMKVVGMVELNTETAYTVASTATNTFALSGVDGSAFTAYTSGGEATKAATTAGEIVIDAQAS